jgi:hypothetical protein
MKIPVTEAMRLKKEISAHIRKIQYSEMESNWRRSKGSDSSVSFGETYSDGLHLIDDGKIDVLQKIQNMGQLLRISEIINSAIANFNHENGIGQMIRTRQNDKFMLEYYDKVVLPNSVASIKSDRDKDSGKISKIEFIPILNKNDIRARIKELKNSVREIQAKVESLNTKMIEVDFSYDDLDDLLSDK